MEYEDSDGDKVGKSFESEEEKEESRLVCSRATVNFARVLLAGR